MKATPILLLVTGFLACRAPAQNNLPDDHPNAPPGTTLTIGADGTASATGVINFPDDRDVFSFQVGANAVLTVYTTGIVDTAGVLKRATSTNEWATVVSEDGGTGNFRISRPVDPGRYAIQVTGRMSAAGFVQQYGLRVEITPNTPVEPPDVDVPEIPQGSTLAFGSQPLNTTVTKSFTVRNAGQGNLLISSITVSGANSAGTTGPFSIEGGGARTLAAGATATVQVRFRPLIAGNFTGQVRINSNDPDENPYSFIVTGSGSGEPPPGPPDVEVPEIPQGSALAFGAQPINTTTTKSFSVKNTGQSNLQISSIVVLGATANGAITTGPFAIEGGGARTVAPGASAMVQIRFLPLATGNYTGSVRINSNDPDENPYSFTVTGSGIGEPPPPQGGEIAVSMGEAEVPSGGEVNFGVITLPSNSPTVRELVISNTGDTDLRLGGVVIAPLPVANPLPPPPAGFFRVLTPPASVVEPGRSTVLRLGAGGNDFNLLPAVQRFTMQALIENSDSNENPYRLLLVAEVRSEPPPESGEIDVFNGDAALADEGTLDFGTTRTGTPVIKTLTIKNTGEEDLRLSSITVEWSGPIIAIFPPPPPPFRVEGVEPRVVAPGASTTCRVIFPATNAGSFESLLKIVNSDADENPFTLSLTGKAEGDVEPPPAPEIAVSMGDADVPPGSTVDFGRTSLTVPVRKTLTISNRGTGTLNVRAGIMAVTREVNKILPFRFSGEPVSSVPPGGSRALSIVFQPMINGSFQALLVISNNDADENPYRLKLSGEGGTDPAAVPDIGLSLGDTQLEMNALIDFGIAAPGTSVRKEVRITNSGSGDLRLGRISFSATSAGGKAGNAGVDPNGNVIGADGAVILPPVGALPFRVLPPPNNVVPAGRSAVLQIVYIAPPSGTQMAMLSIESNDPDESPWKLILKGASSGVAPTPPEIVVKSGDAELPIGGTLNFGKVAIGHPVRREIAVSNIGGGDLKIAGFSVLPAEFFNNDALIFLPPNALVRVVSGPGIIPPGKTAGYVLEMIGFYPGEAVFQARITNNDPDENPYSFRVVGSVIESPVIDPPIIGIPPIDPAGGIGPN